MGKAGSLDRDIETIKKNRLIIYGTGYIARKFYKALAIAGLDKNVLSFAVTCKDGKEESVFGKEIISADEIAKDKDAVICIAVHEVLVKEIEEVLNRYNLKKHILVCSELMLELMLGKAVKDRADIPLEHIIRQSRDLRVAIRYLAIENYFGKNDCGYEIYVRSQTLFSGQKTAEKRLRNFCSLIHNWEVNGYETEQSILIDDRYTLLDGAHRISLAKYFGVEEVICDVYRNSQQFFIWSGEEALSTAGVIDKAGFGSRELNMIYDADRKIRGIEE